jgi:hypothetical protein
VPNRVSGTHTLAYSGFGKSESRRSYSSQALRETLVRAALADKAGVQAASLTAWAGVRVLTHTRRIDAVARALGVRSLDAAARAIDWNWRHPDPNPADG